MAPKTAPKTTPESFNDCDAQLDSLFHHFGKFLYTNIQAGSISYHFDPPDKTLKAQADTLVRNIKAAGNDRRPKPATFSALLRGAQNVLLGINRQRPFGAERRGELEPYTGLVVSLHSILKNLLEIQADLNGCLSLGLLHTSNDRVVAYQHAVNEKLRTIILLVGKNKEVIKLIMEKKRGLLEENTESVPRKAEEDFLKQAARVVAATSRRIDILIGEVVGLFEGIKEAYEKDLKADTAIAEKKYDETAAEEVPLEEEKDEGPMEEEIKQEDIAEEEEQGLFETASRKLASELVSPEEKTEVLHTLFRNAPGRTVPFLYEFIRNADMFLQRQVRSLLSNLDYPEMVSLYRRFITDKQSSLRLQGVMGLVKLGSGEARNVIASVVNDPDPNVRRFIVNYLEHAGGEAEAAAIARLANDSDETVARIAVRKLGLMANQFAFVNLVSKLEAPGLKIRKEAIEMLKAFTGTDLGYNYAAPEPERRRQIRQWNTLARQSYTNPRLLRGLREQLMNKAEKKPEGAECGKHPSISIKAGGAKSAAKSSAKSAVKKRKKGRK
jgi:hypothetical protein